MSMTDAAQRRLGSLLKKLRAKHPEIAAPEILPEPHDEIDPLVHEVVYSILLWDAGSTHARNSLRRIREHVVDYNELRVCAPDEISHIIGEKQPRSLERALRLRCVLNDIFSRQHAVSLAHLVDHPKRETRNYLESLEGMPHFAAARVLLVRLGGHAFPVDRRLRDLLVDENIATDDVNDETLSGQLERHTKAEDSLRSYLLLQAWSDDEGHAPKREKKATEKAPKPKVIRAKPEPKRKKSQAKSGSS